MDIGGVTDATPVPLPFALDQTADAVPAEALGKFVADIPAGVAVFDRELRYAASNASWARAFHLNPAGLLGQRHVELDPTGGALLSELQRRALAGEIVTGCDCTDTDAAGQAHYRAVSFCPRRARDGAIIGVVGALHEVAANLSAKPTDHALDRLTGIAGREAFLAKLRETLADGGDARCASIVFLLDLSGFRGINDLYGTGIGDRVLAAISGLLLGGVRAQPAPRGRSGRTVARRGSDLVARLGADEFGIILGSGTPRLADAEAFARRLLQLVAKPVLVGEQRIRVGANVGFMITSSAHSSEDDVLRDLNVALHEAKLRGPNSYKAWEPALTSAVGRRLALLDELRRALDENEFVLHYQPILNLADGRVVGAEALLRWNHPREGLVPPGQFLPLLEESGLIVQVGGWVIREVVRQMQVWQMLYGRDMLDWVSINVSARQFNDPSLILATLGEINDSGFPLDRLKLEITESAVMRNPEVTSAVLGELRDIGIRVALDDFGTGYSALGALRHYRVDTIKIDRDFTARLETEDGRELVLALLKIARIYGAAVVAEGVETAAQQEILRRADCEYGQGYLFARPMDGSFFGAYALTHLAAQFV